MRVYQWGFLLIIIMMVAGCQPSENGDSKQPNPSDSTNVEILDSDNDNPSITAVPVEALIVKAKPVRENIPLTGIVQSVHSLDIVAEVSGKVTRIVKSLGDRVSLTDTLAVVDDVIPYHQYLQAKAQVMTSENDLKIATLQLKSDEELLENGDISQLAYENALLTKKSAEANLLGAKASLSLAEKGYRDTRIMSPIRGVVSRKMVSLGTMVSQQMIVYRVVDLDHLKLEVGVPQDMIDRVYKGSAAEIRVSALNGKVFSGKVMHVSPQADENTGTYLTEIHLKNTADYKIKAGMTVKVGLVMTERSDRIAVPDYTLVAKDGLDHVYQIQGEKAVLTPINVEDILGTQVILSQGLVDGDTIVMVGMKNLGVETPVAIESVSQQ